MKRRDFLGMLGLAPVVAVVPASAAEIAPFEFSDGLVYMGVDDIDRMTAAYEQRYVKYRSEVIARSKERQSIND